MPHLQYTPGCVGIVSKSGTLSYEAVGATSREGLGQSLCIGVGGDMLPGTSLREGLEALLTDQATKGVVLLGEIGGEAEMEAADFLSKWNAAPGIRRKPVVGMITGRTAPRGRVMGHAGAGEFLPTITPLYSPSFALLLLLRILFLLFPRRQTLISNPAPAQSPAAPRAQRTRSRRSRRRESESRCTPARLAS